MGVVSAAQGVGKLNVEKLREILERITRKGCGTLANRLEADTAAQVVNIRKCERSERVR